MLELLGLLLKPNGEVEYYEDTLDNLIHLINHHSTEKVRVTNLRNREDKDYYIVISDVNSTSYNIVATKLVNDTVPPHNIISGKVILIRLINNKPVVMNEKCLRELKEDLHELYLRKVN